MEGGPQYGDSLASDVSKVANAAVDTTKAAMALAKAGAHLAAGDVVGAGVEVVKNGTLLKTLVITVFIAVLFSLCIMLAPAILLVQLPSSIIGGLADAMGRAADTTQLNWLIADANMKAAADNFWGFITGNSEDPVEFVDSAASYFDDNYDSYWGETNLQMAVLNSYFKKSYTNACKRAQSQSQIDEEIDKEKLKKDAEDAGYNSSRIYFTTSEFLPSESAGYQKIACYIIALDSWKYTNDTDAQVDKSAADTLSRMVEVAKKISPNGFIDSIETALDIEDEHLWVVTYDTVGEAGTEVTGKKQATTTVPDPNDPSKTIEVPVYNEDGTPKMVDVTEPKYTYTTTISVELNGNIREKLYEEYGIDPTETRSNHSGIFLPEDESTADTTYTATGGEGRVALTVADVIEQNVQRLLEIYGIPNITGATGGTSIGGGMGSENPLTQEQIDAIKEALANESANLTDKQAAVVAFAMEIINSPYPEQKARELEVTHFGGLCQGFLTDIFTLSGAYSGPRPGSALEGYRMTDPIHPPSEPPQPGASLYFNSDTAPEFGHVVLYVGGGITLETWSSGVVISTFESVINRSWSHYLGWGYLY